MFIERDFNTRPVTDFLKNIKHKINDSKVAEEVYRGKILVGWRIKELVKN